MSKYSAHLVARPSTLRISLPLSAFESLTRLPESNMCSPATWQPSVKTLDRAMTFLDRNLVTRGFVPVYSTHQGQAMEGRGGGWTRVPTIYMP